MDINNWNTGKIYDYIFDLHIARNYLNEVIPITRNRFTGKNIFVKLKNVLERPFKFVKQGLNYELVYKQANKSKNIDGKIWLFSFTKNNRDSLSFLLEHLEEAVCVGPGTPIGKYKDAQLPFYRSLLYAYKFPSIYLHLYQQYGAKVLGYFDLIFRCTGYFETAVQMVKEHRPKCIVMANDHSPLPRALRLAAAKYNIPCVYIQHASVAHYHPTLDFELNLLEGLDAKEKYLSKGKCAGKIELIGMPKFDLHLKDRNFSPQVKKVAICTNLWEKVSDVELLIKEMRDQFPDLLLSFRPHPADTRKFQFDKAVILSTKEESAFQFLKKQDLIIAANTSIHLEAVLLNIVSIHYEISQIKEDFHDYYGYLKNNLVPEAKTKSDLFELISKQSIQKVSVFKNARYYNELVGTENEGKSGELAAAHINNLISSTLSSIAYESF